MKSKKLDFRRASQHRRGGRDKQEREKGDHNDDEKTKRRKQDAMRSRYLQIGLSCAIPTLSAPVAAAPPRPLAVMRSCGVVAVVTATLAFVAVAALLLPPVVVVMMVALVVAVGTRRGGGRGHHLGGGGRRRRR